MALYGALWRRTIIVSTASVGVLSQVCCDKSCLEKYDGKEGRLTPIPCKKNEKVVLPIFTVVWNQTDTFSFEVPVQLVNPSLTIVLIGPSVNTQPECNYS